MDSLFYKSKLLLKSPNGQELEIKNYDLKIKESSNIKNFTLKTEMIDLKTIRDFTIGSTLEVWTAKKGEDLKHIYTGVITKFPKSLDGKKKTFDFSGGDYLVKTQKKVINEAYENWNVGDIFSDLVTKYAPYLTLGEIDPISYNLEKIVFKDEYLFTCFERLGDTINYTTFVDKDKKIYFKNKTISRTNKTIRKNDFEKGSASFEVSTDKLTNKVTAYGGQGTSESFIEYIEGDSKNHVFSLKYRPLSLEGSPIKVVDQNTGTSLKVGADYLHTFSDGYDCLINSNEKLIKFNPNSVPTTSDLYSVEYLYSYPLVFEMDHIESRDIYGDYERVMKFKDVDTRIALRDRVDNYLKKYAYPILVGSLKPFNAFLYDVNTEIKVEIEELGVDDYLLITEKTISIKNGVPSFDLKFEEHVDMQKTLKSIHERIKALEKQNQDEVVEKFSSIVDDVEVIEDIFALDEKHFIIGQSKVGDVI